jgi:hypothetical protein
METFMLSSTAVVVNDSWTRWTHSMLTDDDELLEFANHFLGYGKLDSALWLIGPEAGGGQTTSEVYQRASVWAKRGRKETEDLQTYHADLGLDWTRKIQATWGPLIRVILALDGKRAERKDVREFQKLELGALGGQNAVLDLSQLSSPSLSTWEFHKCGISSLGSRDEYEGLFLQSRCDLLRERISRYKPSLVLFYGLSHLRWWEHISGSQFEKSQLPQLSWARGENIFFAMIPHPRGVRIPGKGAHNRFFADVGAALRENLR